MMINRMKSLGVISFMAILVALLFVVGIARQAEDPGVLLRAAIEKEEVDGNLQAAIDLYKQIVAKHGDSRAIAAKAQLHIGLCYEKLGLEEAPKAFQKVVDNYPDQTEAATLAKEKLAVFLRARAIIEKGDQEFKIIKIYTDRSRYGYFSPDGKKLALIDGKTNDLWLRDIASGHEVRILSSASDFHDCFWSPDSQWIAYITGTNNVDIVPAEGGQPKTIIEVDPEVLKAGDYVWPTGWTSDSKKLIVQDCAKGLFAVPVSGGNREEIYKFPDPKKAKERDEWLTLSPDGRLLAFQSTQGGNQDIYVMPVQGGEPVRITDDPASDNGPLWSYDGQWLAFDSSRTGRNETWVIRITPDGQPGGQPVQATRGGGGGVWTQDGRIAYSTDKEIFHVFVANADGSGEVQLTKLNKWNVGPRWSRDAKTIAFSTVRGEGREGRRAVWTVPSNGGEEKFLALGDNPVWSPDGKTMALIPFTGYPPVQAKISIVPTAGGEAKELMSYDGALTNLDWSPDGQYFAFSYSRGKEAKNPIPDSRMDIEDIYIIPETGGEPKRLTQMDKKGFRFTSPRWSPDGKKIAFRSLDYEGWEKGRQSEAIAIYTIDIGGGEPKLVTNEFDHWWFCWSPDGKNIIFPKQDKDSPGPYGADRRLYKVSAEGGTPEKLNIMGMMPDFSPDGKKIAYSRLSEDSTEYWMVENFLAKETAAKNGPEGLAIRKVCEGGGSSVSPDGRYITFTDEYNLAVRDLLTGKTRRLTEKGSLETRFIADRSVFSPDGRQIAYEWFNADGTWDLRLIGLDGSGLRVLVHRDNGDEIYPCGWSPDGKQILVGFWRLAGPGTLTGELAFVSAADGTVKIIKPTHTTNGPTIMGTNLSPDGRYITYHAPAAGGSKQNDLFLLSSDGTRDAPLLEHPANDHSPVWTPDGKKILFISDRAGTPGFWIIDVLDGKSCGEPRLVKPDIGDIYKGLGFTRQGAYYYALSVSMGDIYVADLNPATGKIQGKPEVLASRFAHKLEPAWSPDGQHLAFFRRTGSDSWVPGWRTIFIRNNQTGEERELSNRLILSGWARWFPDGRSLLVSGSREGDSGIDFYRVDVKTGETSLLMKRAGGAGSFWPGLSPDGKTIFFTYYRGGGGDNPWRPGDCFLGSYQIETRQEKEVCQILPRDQRYRQSIAVSPDGRQLAFVVHEGSWPVTSVVKVVSPEGGEPRELFRSPWPGFIPGNQALEWTPDGRYLLVVRGSMSSNIGELLRIPAEGGEAQVVGLTAKGLSSPSVRSDGKQLAYHAVSEASNEIWVMENFLKSEK
jgi:Tol biopolymer transport system component